MTSWMSVLYVVEGFFFLRFWKSVGFFFFFWSFMALLNRNSEEWQESGGREREEDMRQVISDSNIGRPLLAIHHVVACSPQWAKPAPHVWCFSDADKYEPFIDVLGVHLFPIPLCNKKSLSFTFLLSASAKPWSGSLWLQRCDVISHSQRKLYSFFSPQSFFYWLL